MPWLFHGLRKGVVTTRWPARPDSYFDQASNLATTSPEPADLSLQDAVDACPTGAIGIIGNKPNVAADRCIGCGICVRGWPDVFEFTLGATQAHLADDGAESPEELAVLRANLSARARTFGRSVHIRHVDAGSDGTEEWEINALLNPVYDIQRLGIFFTASPRHADILLVTGIGATGMRAPLERTLEAMPRPVIVIAVGTDACTGGVFAHTYASSGGIGAIINVDVWVPGSPPTPFAILNGILLALDRLPAKAQP